MKVIYTLIIAIIAITGAVSLTGCGKSSKSGGGASTSAPTDNLTALKQAVEAYHTKEGNYPKTLDDLVPTYIAQIPAGRAGYHYAYDPATGEVTLTRGELGR